MSVIVIGTGGHKAAQEIRTHWDNLTPDQRQAALDAESAYVGALQAILDQVLGGGAS